MSDLYPRFTLNRCGAVSTDNAHRVRFKAGVKPENISLSYYNSISFAFTELCGRAYGGGVLEILPGEARKIVLPKLDGIDERSCQSLLCQIDNIIRKKSDIEEALDIVDKEVLSDILGIDSEWMQICRTVWKKMQHRRRSRMEGRKGGKRRKAQISLTAN